MAAAFARRARYIELRQAGVRKWDAAGELELDYGTACRYERWYQAVQYGKIPWPPTAPRRKTSGEEDR